MYHCVKDIDEDDFEDELEALGDLGIKVMPAPTRHMSAYKCASVTRTKHSRVPNRFNHTKL